VLDAIERLEAPVMEVRSFDAVAANMAAAVGRLEKMADFAVSDLAPALEAFGKGLDKLEEP
jgi:hypothetical protein